ncbi:hypothetical protein M422DRAFT_24252 [Sphaerobolus stellatus SS14]|nr:hypothetical protein M422DRAFT_24252 [Sphaerobolus stellatus SS14]
MTSTPVEMEYYDLLGVPADVGDIELKKAYRKKAIQYHPDKNSAPEAEEKFKEISKAFQILSDPNTRAVYDRHGQSMVDKEGPSMEDAAGFFANIFGGERFHDYVGEISLMKEMTNVATAVMSEEEKTELDRELKREPQQSMLTGEVPGSSTLPAAEHGAEGHVALTPEQETDLKDAKRKRPKLTPEQREKLDALEKERTEARKKRVEDLHRKLIERLRSFVEAKNPGHPDDPETKAFEARIKKEAEDLKLESFGVELLHTIGNVYMMKATSYMKSRKFLGIPGFFSRLKEKGALAKDAWGVIGSALSVQGSIEQMARLQEKGEIPEEQLRELESDVTGKVLLASWRGTRFEVVNVLRDVCDQLFKEPGVPEQAMVNRAKGLLIMGAIFKAATPDESEQERRELERIVAEAAAPKKKSKKLSPQPTPNEKPKPQTA